MYRIIKLVDVLGYTGAGIKLRLIKLIDQKVHGQVASAFYASRIPFTSLTAMPEIIARVAICNAVFSSARANATAKSRQFRLVRPSQVFKTKTQESSAWFSFVESVSFARCNAWIDYRERQSTSRGKKVAKKLKQRYKSIKRDYNL